MADIYNFDSLSDEHVSIESEVRALRRELNRLKRDNEHLKETVSKLNEKVLFHEGARQALPYFILFCMIGTVILAVYIMSDIVGV